MISQVKRTWRAHYGFWPINDCLCATWHARAPRDTPHLSIIHRHLAQSIYSCVIPRSRSGLHLERQLVSLVAFYQIESATRILSQIDVFELRVYVFYRYKAHKLSGKHLKWITWLLTGHSPLAYFQHKSQSPLRTLSSVQENQKHLNISSVSA